MQIPILAGVFTDQNADIRNAYPVNLMPVAVDSGISKGYLRPSDGLVFSNYALQPPSSGVSRGGINWNGKLYRVVGTKLVRIESDSSFTVLGDVGGTGQCTLDYSFDRLGISSGGKLYYWDGASLTQVTDPDLMGVLDFIWVDGYFMTTDGTSLIVTELNDPTSVDPLKYGSSEVDPDPINSVMKLRNEPVAVNRYTIEFFRNQAGAGFPFQRIEGAQILKGSVGTYASCIFQDAIAFVGSGRNEQIAIYLAVNAQSQKISTNEIEALLANYSTAQLSTIFTESRIGNGMAQLWIHLPDRTLVYDVIASGIAGQPVWTVMTSTYTPDTFSEFRGKDLVYCYDKWNIADPQSSQFGVLSQAISTHWGQLARWEFSTQIFYNEGHGAIFYSLELVSLTGRIPVNPNPDAEPEISSSYSLDGETWSQDKYVKVGKNGNRLKRIIWFGQGKMQNWRVQRFRGTSEAFLSIARLEAVIEPLAV